MLELQKYKQASYAVTYTNGGNSTVASRRSKAAPPRRATFSVQSKTLLPKKFATYRQAEAFIAKLFQSKQQLTEFSPEVVPYNEALSLQAKWFTYWMRTNKRTGKVDTSKPTYADYLKELANVRAKAKQAT